MAKKILFAFLQFLLFLVALAGSFLNPFHLTWRHTVVDNVERFYVPDGLLLATGILLAIVVIQAVRRRLCNTPWTILAFVLAVAIGYRFGFVTHDLSQALPFLNIHANYAG
jgi:ABC-type uncharacterized transport system permease subunit